jgi:3-oxoacyl-(acyl-carrier-protein) synthase
MRRVVITGLGVLAPNGNGIDSFSRALQEGRSGIRAFDHLQQLQFSCRIGGIPQGVDELRRRHFSEEELLSMNQTLSLAVLTALECWKDAGLSDARSTPHTHEDTGAVIGTGLAGIDSIAAVIRAVDAKNVRRLGSTMVENAMVSGSSAGVCNFLGLGGQVTTNSSACTTGTEAIAEAYFKIKEGRADRMLAGGVEAASPYVWGPFDAMRVLARKYNETPEKGSRPLSASADGFVPAAGGGLLMLEELTTAQRRGARIYAEVLGAEVNSGGQRNGGSMTAPGSAGVIRCIRKTLERAAIAPQEIDLINGHLTGTFADPHEVNNWAAALELSPAEFPMIQATKSMIGHALGAAGGIECVAAILQLRDSFIHPSLNCEDLHPDLLPYQSKIAQQTLYRPLDIVIKAGFGFGDVNGCIIFKKWKV